MKIILTQEPSITWDFFVVQEMVVWSRRDRKNRKRNLSNVGHQKTLCWQKSMDFDVVISNEKWII